jgi:hypothetical protein
MPYRDSSSALATSPRAIFVAALLASSAWRLWGPFGRAPVGRTSPSGGGAGPLPTVVEKEISGEQEEQEQEQEEQEQEEQEQEQEEQEQEEQEQELFRVNIDIRA